MLSKLWGLSMGEVAFTLSVLAQQGAINQAHLPDGRVWCLPQPQQLQLLHTACREVLRGYHQQLLDAYTGAGLTPPAAAWSSRRTSLSGPLTQQPPGAPRPASPGGLPAAAPLGGVDEGGPAAAALGGAFRRPLRLQEVRDDGYFLINVGHHLMGAGRHLAMRGLLLDPGWLAAKLAAAGPTGVVADFRRCRGVWPYCCCRCCCRCAAAAAAATGWCCLHHGCRSLPRWRALGSVLVLVVAAAGAASAAACLGHLLRQPCFACHQRLGWAGSVWVGGQAPICRPE